MLNNHQKNIATFIHLSTFLRFFIPLGNLIGPIILWGINKDKSEFIDYHGKQAINFQISILLYSLIIGIITLPFFVFKFLGGIDFMGFQGFRFDIDIDTISPLLCFTGFVGFLGVIAFLIELAFIIRASFKARDGVLYQYPLTINFIK